MISFFSDPTAAEQIVSARIVNPETGASSRTFRFMGRIDRIEGRRVIDWKSLANIKDYINKTKIGFQAELYAIALREHGIEIDGIEYRLIERPSIKYCGKDATAKDYEDRCVEWLCQPMKLLTYDRLVTPSRIARAEAWLWGLTQKALGNRRSGFWETNEHACHSWNRSCEFLEICLAAADGANVEEVVARDYEVSVPHEELDNHDDKDVMTYSSASTLAHCAMKYYLRNERALRLKHEDADARWTGSAVHAGLGAFPATGYEGACKAIEAFAESNPVLGVEDNRKQDQEIAKARAIVRAAAEKWPVAA